MTRRSKRVTKAKLKRKIDYHLRKLGFRRHRNGNFVLRSSEKQIVRTLHAQQRLERLKSNKAFIKANTPNLIKHFASGTDIVPSEIRPVLQRVYSGTWESELFRLASLSWSVPVSSGFGRRLRYLVWDDSNGKLIGLLAIGDPVFNLSVRDQYISWNADDRGKRLVNILDAYVLGALPPYNTLLCGKLVACLLKTRELYKDFKNEYGGTRGIISGKKKEARLLAITTTSSMGRSSVYNRLKINDVEYLKPLGYTGGWGHFHIPENIFEDMRTYLRISRHPYADLHKFGDGPNWRLRTARAALDGLGFKADMLKHGIGREVFIAELASNAKKILSTGKGKPNTSKLRSVEDVSAQAIHRWVIPRSLSRMEYLVWTPEQFKYLLSENINIASMLTPRELVDEHGRQQPATFT